MIEKGTVTSVEGRWVTVRIEMQEGCSACSSSDACATGKHLVKALDRSGLAPEIGSRVGVEVSASEQARGALLLLGLPLALFAAGYAAGRALWPAAGEGPAAIFGLGGLAGGVAVAAFIERGRKEVSMPSVVPLAS